MGEAIKMWLVVGVAGVAAMTLVGGALGGNGRAEKNVDSSESSSDEDVVLLPLLNDVDDPAALRCSSGSDMGKCQAARSIESAPAAAADGLEYADEDAGEASKCGEDSIGSPLDTGPWQSSSSIRSSNCFVER